MIMLRALGVAIVALLAAPVAAGADGARLKPVDVPATDLADAAGAVAPTAAMGHVVFSRWVQERERFELVDWSARSGLRVLPAGDRAVPFDADLGTTAGGDAVVTYSRCATDGKLSYVLPTVDFTGARGCRPYVLALTRANARPHRLRLARSTELSLTTPSMRSGSVAAVAGGYKNARVLYWKRTTQPPIRLRGGSPPDCPYARCPVAPRSGVDALDLGARSVAFVWRLTLPPLGVGPGLELRTSSLRPSGVGRRVVAGYLSGACGFRQPTSPSAGGAGGATFLLAQSPCEELQTTLAAYRSGSASVLGARPAGALAYGAAFDQAGVYWLRGNATEDSFDQIARAPVPCARPRAGCRLVLSATLPLAPAFRAR